MLSLAILHNQTTSFPDYILLTLKTSGGISPPDDIIWDNWQIDFERYVAVLYSVDKGLHSTPNKYWKVPRGVVISARHTITDSLSSQKHLKLTNFITRK